MTDVLPTWSVEDLYPSLTSRAFTDASEGLAAGVQRLVALYDQHHVGADNASTDGIDDVLAATNDVHRKYATIGTVVTSVVAVDSTDPDGQRAQSQLRSLGATLGALGARLAAWVGTAGAEALTAAGPVAADHAWPLQRLAVRAQHQMLPAQEDLYSELSTTGAQAWAQMFNDVTSQISVEVEGRGRIPMTAVRGLAMHADPAVRTRAYEAELGAWPTVAVPLAAAMNAIKGEANIVNGRRKWDSPLDASLYANSVDKPTYEAMTEAVRASLPDFRAWMRTKASLHGYQGGLRWQDLFAPLPAAASSVSWAEGCDRVNSAFASYSPALAALSQRAMDDRWIDAGPRAGKRGGAFCASLKDDRSLVLMNWSSSADSISTLAHELGHAYHNTQLAHRTPLQRQLPMALAETASIFCETLLVEDGLTRATGMERLALLDVDLQGSCQVVVDIHSRVLFETEVFARRQQRTLNPDELCALMIQAQEDSYGDGLHADLRHPYMWAVKPHYYSSHFYNWPYTFGLLFGLGLFANYRQDPERFRGGYDDLLSNVALASASELGARFGIDVTDVGFWTASLDQIRLRMAEYATLAASLS